MRWGILYGRHLCPAGITGSLFIALAEFGLSSVSPASGLGRLRVQSRAAFLTFLLPMKAASRAGHPAFVVFAHSGCVCPYINTSIAIVVMFSVAVGAEEGKKPLRNVGEIKPLQRWLKPSLVF